MMKERFGWVFGKPIQVLFEEFDAQAWVFWVEKNKSRFWIWPLYWWQISSRHKQRFYILASALIEHFLEGVGKNHSLIFFQLIHLLSSKICLLAKWRPLCEITYTSGCWWSSQTWLLYIYLSLVSSSTLVYSYHIAQILNVFFPYKRLLIVKNYRNPILWQLLKYIR